MQAVKDYLLRKTRDSNPELEVFRVKEEAGNLEIAIKCLDYLQNGALTDGKVDLLKNAAHLKAFPLLSYDALHWPEHARSLARSEDIFILSHPFYRKKSWIWESWLKIYWAAEKYSEPPNSFTILHLASCFGILPLAENLLLEKGLINRVKHLFYLNKKDDSRRTALIWATKCGYEAVARLLLEKGADVRAKDSSGETALYRAAHNGHEAVVRLLLEKGANVEAKDSHGWTAPHWAAHNKHEAIIRPLLEKEADIEAKDSSGKTALYWVPLGGDEAVVRLLTPVNLNS